MVLEKTLESPLDCKEIQPVHPKGNTSGYSLEGLMPTLKFQYFGHLMWKTDSLEKTLMLGKTEVRKEKGVTEDEMVGWHQWLNGHEFEQVLGVGEGQGSLVCCSPWGRKESYTTEQLNLAEVKAAVTITWYFYQFSRSVMCDCLRPNGLKYTRLPCPSPTPRTCSNSCPLSWWCHPTISSCGVPFSSRLLSFPALGSFPIGHFFPSSGQSIGHLIKIIILDCETF